MNRKQVEDWLEKLKNNWFNKNVEEAISLFKKTTYYQETPFMEPYTTFEEISKEWQHVKEQEIKEIKFIILAIENRTAIIEWIFKRDICEFNGIYEIRFNEDGDCTYFRSWEMEKR